MTLSPSYAARMAKHKPASYCKAYLEREPGVELLPCQYGHPDCAQIPGGPCREELATLLNPTVH
jgi:hypothetical protein